MTVLQSKVKFGRNSADQTNLRLTALVDHLAVELAREYVQLMENAAKEYSVQLNATENDEE